MATYTISYNVGGTIKGLVFKSDYKPPTEYNTDFPDNSIIQLPTLDKLDYSNVSWSDLRAVNGWFVWGEGSNAVSEVDHPFQIDGLSFEKNIDVLQNINPLTFGQKNENKTKIIYNTSSFSLKNFENKTNCRLKINFSINNTNYKIYVQYLIPDSNENTLITESIGNNGYIYVDETTVQDPLLLKLNIYDSSNNLINDSVNLTYSYTEQYKIEYQDSIYDPEYKTYGEEIIVKPILDPSIESDKVQIAWMSSVNSVFYGSGDSYTLNAPTEFIPLYVRRYVVFFDTQNENLKIQPIRQNASGGTITLPNIEDNRFKGWYTSPSNGTKVGDGGASYTPNERTTLYAQWKENVTYTVRFNGNGSTRGSMPDQTFTYGETKELTANAFQRDLFIDYIYNGSDEKDKAKRVPATFSGWATSSDGPVVYGNSQSVGNLTDIDGKTVNLYAKWIDGSTELLPATREGYLFLGWYDAAFGGDKIGDGGSIYFPTDHITLYAYWKKLINYTGLIYLQQLNLNQTAIGEYEYDQNIVGTGIVGQEISIEDFNIPDDGNYVSSQAYLVDQNSERIVEYFTLTENEEDNKIRIFIPRKQVIVNFYINDVLKLSKQYYCEIIFNLPFDELEINKDIIESVETSLTQMKEYEQYQINSAENNDFSIKLYSKFNLNFENGNGNIIKSYQFYENEEIIISNLDLPTITPPQGYTLLGWKEKGTTTNEPIDSLFLNQDTTLIPIWKKIGKQIIFKLKKENGDETIGTVDVAENSTFTFGVEHLYLKKFITKESKSITDGWEYNEKIYGINDEIDYSELNDESIVYFYNVHGVTATTFKFRKDYDNKNIYYDKYFEVEFRYFQPLGTIMEFDNNHILYDNNLMQITGTPSSNGIVYENLDVEKEYYILSTLSADSSHDSYERKMIKIIKAESNIHYYKDNEKQETLKKEFGTIKDNIIKNESINSKFTYKWEIKDEDTALLFDDNNELPPRLNDMRVNFYYTQFVVYLDFGGYNDREREELIYNCGESVTIDNNYLETYYRLDKDYKFIYLLGEQAGVTSGYDKTYDSEVYDNDQKTISCSISYGENNTEIKGIKDSLTLQTIDVIVDYNKTVGLNEQSYNHYNISQWKKQGTDVGITSYDIQPSDDNITFVPYSIEGKEYTFEFTNINDGPYDQKVIYPNCPSALSESQKVLTSKSNDYYNVFKQWKYTDEEKNEYTFEKENDFKEWKRADGVSTFTYEADWYEYIDGQVTVRFQSDEKIDIVANEVKGSYCFKRNDGTILTKEKEIIKQKGTNQCIITYEQISYYKDIVLYIQFDNVGTLYSPSQKEYTITEGLNNLNDPLEILVIYEDYKDTRFSWTYGGTVGFKEIEEEE